MKLVKDAHEVEPKHECEASEAKSEADLEADMR